MSYVSCLEYKQCVWNKPSRLSHNTATSVSTNHKQTISTSTRCNAQAYTQVYTTNIGIFCIVLDGSEVPAYNTAQLFEGRWRPRSHNHVHHIGRVCTQELPLPSRVVLTSAEGLFESPCIYSILLFVEFYVQINSNWEYHNSKIIYLHN